MRVAALVLVAVLVLVTPAHAAGSPVDYLNQVLQFLQQVWQKLDQMYDWMWQLTRTLDPVLDRISPLLDRAYAVKDLAEWVKNAALGLPEELRWVLGSLENKLRNAATPKPWTTPWLVQEIAKQAPDSETVKKARGLDEMAVKAEVSAAAARATAEKVRESARKVSEDTSPAADVEAGSLAAQEIMARVQSAPSTRAAVGILTEAVAAQMDQLSRMSMHSINRLTTMISQQAALSQQIATSVDLLAQAVQQQNEMMKDEFNASVKAASEMLQGQVKTYSEMGAATLGIVSPELDRSAEEYFKALRRR
jgi:hypothetical protein